MSELPTHYVYTHAHEWLDHVNKTRVRIGVTEVLQDLLGMIVFIELPELNSQIRAGESYGCLESVKTVSDLCSPVSGQVVAVNELLRTNPELVNLSPYHQGWLIEVECIAEQLDQLDNSMTSEAYSRWMEEHPNR